MIDEINYKRFTEMLDDFNLDEDIDLEKDLDLDDEDHYEGEDDDYGISEKEYAALLDSFENYDAVDNNEYRDDIYVSGRFCDECGQPVGDEDIECPNCGNKIEDPTKKDVEEWDDILDPTEDDYHSEDLYESKDADIEHIGYADELPKEVCPKCGKPLDDPDGAYCLYCDCDIKDCKDECESK